MKNLRIVILLFVMLQVSYSQSASFHVTKNGTGKPVMFLPGFTCPASVWDETQEKLGNEYESHMISYAGFNGNEPIGTPWYNPIIKQLTEYIQSEGLEELVLIGHSMGGNVAIDLAAALPNRVNALILIEALPCMREMMMPGVPASSIQYDSPYNNQMLNMTEEAFQQMATGMSQNMTNNSEKVEVLTNWALKADRETYVYGYTDLLKLDQRELLPEISAKTLILGASFPSKQAVLNTYEMQYTSLHKKEIKIADNSKHFIMFDQPVWLSNNINDFLNSHE